MNYSDISLDTITDQVIKEEKTPSFLENWEGPLLLEKSFGHSQSSIPRPSPLRVFLKKVVTYIGVHNIQVLIASLGVVAIVWWVVIHWPQRAPSLISNSVAPIAKSSVGPNKQPEVTTASLQPSTLAAPHKDDSRGTNTANLPPSLPGGSVAKSNTAPATPALAPSQAAPLNGFGVSSQPQPKYLGSMVFTGSPTQSYAAAEPVDRVVLQTDSGVVFRLPPATDDALAAKAVHPQKTPTYSKEQLRREKQRRLRRLRMAQGQKILTAQQAQQAQARISPPRQVAGQKFGPSVPPVVVESKPLSDAPGKADPDSTNKCPLAVADRTVWLAEGQMFVRSDGLWVCQRVGGKLSAQRKNPR